MLQDCILFLIITKNKMQYDISLERKKTMAVIVAAEADLEYAQEIQEWLHAKDKFFPVRVCNAQHARDWELLEREIEDGGHLFALFTRNLVRDKKLVLNLISLVRRCMHHLNGFGNFFHPVYFEGSNERHYLPLFFQGWKGLHWFSLKKQLLSIMKKK